MIAPSSLIGPKEGQKHENVHFNGYYRYRGSHAGRRFWDCFRVFWNSFRPPPDVGGGGEMKTIAFVVGFVALCFYLFLAESGPHLGGPVGGKSPAMTEVELPRVWIPPVAEPLSSDLEKKKVEPVQIKPSSSRTTEDVLIERKARIVIKKYGHIIKEAALVHGIDWREITAFTVIESEGDPNAKSSSGARGLMQLKNAAAKDVGVKNPFNPRENIFGGARYLSILKKQGHKNVQDRALAYYNGAKGADRFLASGRNPREHFYVPQILHAYKVVKDLG